MKTSCLLAALSFAAMAQTQTASNNARPRIDLDKYVITADVNPRTQSVDATAQISFKALDKTDHLVFELNNALAVSKATDAAGNNLQVNRNAQDFTIDIALAKPLAKNDASTVTIAYAGKLTGNEDGPIYGLKFAALHPDFGYLLYPSRWFPVSGYTTSRYAAELHITTPSEYRVVSSGDLKTSPAPDSKTQFNFVYDKKGFPGSIGIVKDAGTKVSSQGFNSEIYFRGAQADYGKEYGEEIGKVMTFLTSLYGLAPKANLQIVETEAGAVNEFSAPGLVFLAPEAITEKVNRHVLVNGLARQWFGVLVSPATRNHIWIMNGAARFSEMLYLGHEDGPGAMESDVENDYIEALTVKDPPMLQSARLEDYSPEYWALTAAKGAAVMNMLHNIVGEDNFKRGMHDFIDKYSGQSVTSDDLRKVMEKDSGQELRYFFIQWLESTGSPQFKLDYTVLRTPKGFRVVGKINQDLDTFRMPIDLLIETEGNPEKKRVDVTGTSTEFSLDTFGKPRKVTVDPDHVLLRLDPSIQVRVAIKRGEQYVEINDYANALHEYESAIDVNKLSSLAHFRIGELFFKQNNYQSAANEFRSAIDGDLDPKWTEVWSHIYLGKIFDVTGQRDRAMNEYRKAIRTHDDTGGAQAEAAKYSTHPFEPENSELSSR